MSYPAICDTNTVVILRRKKGPVIWWSGNKQVLRFAQDDNTGVSTVALILRCFQINSYLLRLLIKMRSLQSQGPRRVRDLVVIAFQLGQNGLFLESADAIG